MKHNDIKNFAEYRNNIEMLLLSGPCYAIFEKKDGSVRHMICTKHYKLIPQKQPVDSAEANAASKTYKKKSEDAISAYDLEKKEWRSFLIHNIRFFEKLENIKTGGKNANQSG